MYGDWGTEGDESGLASVLVLMDDILDLDDGSGDTLLKVEVGLEKVESRWKVGGEKGRWMKRPRRGYSEPG